MGKQSIYTNKTSFKLKQQLQIYTHVSLKITREGTKPATHSPAKYQASTRSLHNEENKRDPYTRRPSTSTPSISEPTSRRSSEGKSEDEKTGRTSQDDSACHR